MRDLLKILYYRLRYIKKNVKFGKRVTLNTNHYFEGWNAIGKNTEISYTSVGLGSYISDNCLIRMTQIGRFCSIGSNVQMGIGTHPTRVYVSTHPAFFSTSNERGFTFTEEDIFEELTYIDPERKYVLSIGNDVWVGSNVIFTDGLYIGNGAVIAAGAVVTKDVPPYAIVGGIPAKIIRFRFTDEEIQKLNSIKWWDWEFAKLKQQSHLFNNINEFLENTWSK
jgi:acetyltransferase-like isoleucine patch superfamily enzyme